MRLCDAPINILRIVRIHIVLGGILAFTLGALLAIAGGGTFNFSITLLFYAIVLFGDLSTHFSNNYFDTDCDKYIKNKKFFAGNNILVDNPSLRLLAHKASLSLLMLSNGLAITAVLLQIAPIELLLITAGANFLGWAYSAPPLRLVSRGGGEMAIAIAAGFAIPAVGYLSVRGQLDLLFAYFAIPFILYGLMLSLSLEAPDIKVDMKTGKRNLGVRRGEKAIVTLIVTAAAIAEAIFLFYAWQIEGVAIDWKIITLFSTIPLSAGLVNFILMIYRKSMIRAYASNIISLFCFNALMIAHLLLTTTTR